MKKIQSLSKIQVALMIVSIVFSSIGLAASSSILMARYASAATSSVSTYESYADAPQVTFKGMDPSKPVEDQTDPDVATYGSGYSKTAVAIAGENVKADGTKTGKAIYCISRNVDNQYVSCDWSQHATETQAQFYSDQKELESYRAGSDENLHLLNIERVRAGLPVITK